MIYINCLLIEIIFVIAIDVLHFWDELSKIISGIITKGKVKKPFDLKPFSCSTCMSFWVNLGYIVFSGHFSVVNVAIIIVLAMLAPEIGGLIFMFKSWIDALIKKITIE